MSLPATLVVHDDATTEHAARVGRIVDLSLGGARASLGQTIPVGSRVTLVLSAPQLWDPLEVPGIIAWTRQALDHTEHGIRFDHRSVATPRALGELLEALLFG